VQICPKCGEENPDRFRLCGYCGERLAPEAPPQEVRKTVTIVFSDLKGSTSLGEKLDSESLREVLNTYFTDMKTVLERHGGTVEKFIGDAIMAVFGLPRLHEDDALRAVRAAAEMKTKLVEVNDRLEARWGVRLENRTGVNTGEVVAGDVTTGQRLVTGDTVNTAARLEQAAPATEVLIGESTYRLVKDAVEVEAVEPLSLKGKAEPVPAYRLIVVKEGEAVTRRLDAPMVGRTEELQALIEALAQAERDRSCRLVTVLGPAGVGKSRLLHEFLRLASERATILRGRCLPYGEGITFWPLGEIARGAAGVLAEDSLEAARAKLAACIGAENEAVTDRVGAAIGLTTAAFPVQETFWATRRFFEILATRRPLVLLIDDIHWAERTFLDLLREVVESVEDAAVVLACSSRGDLLEDHPDWAEDRPNFRRIALEPLSARESAQVIENVLGSPELDAAIRAKIIEAADGNPLFVEQMLSMLLDDGVLARDEGGRWSLTTDLGSFTVPASVQALLSARLDRLASDQRAVIERGAVIGQVFGWAAVEGLVPEALVGRVRPNLVTLAKKQLLLSADDEQFRFAHILIRDAAYHGLLKRTRAELHERFVDWLEHEDSDRVTEFEEIRGYHLEQAYLTLVELGLIDDHVQRVGARGSAYLSSAGHRALARGDMPAAGNLLRRAASLLPMGDHGRPKLMLEAAEALIEAGEFIVADAALQSAVEGAQTLGLRGLATAASLVRLQRLYTTVGEGTEEQLVQAVQEAIPLLEELGDHEGLARAWRLLTMVHWTADRNGPAEQSTLKVIEHARLAGNRLMETRFLTSLAMCALYGPRPVPEAIERCQEILDKAGGDRKTTSLTLLVLSFLEAMRGDFPRARELYQQSRSGLEELGWKMSAALTSLVSGAVEMLAGDPVRAEGELRHDYEALEAMGERNYISTTAAFLGQSLYEQGRYDEAERFTTICREIAASDDVPSQSLWRCVQGKVLARRGELAAGETLVREGLAIIARSDDPNSHGNALMDLAEVLRLAGRHEEASLASKEAAVLFESKGNVVSTAKVWAFLEASIRVELSQQGGGFVGSS
jgi:predicted ATPase/class 3 adenylate cyclase